MRKTSIFLIGFLLTFLFSYTQPGALNPTDPDLVFTSTYKPSAPSYGIISKWGHAQRHSWGSFAYGYKSYYFKGLALRIKFPQTYQHNIADGKKYPLLVFLHGAGEKGDIWDNEWSLLHGGQNHATKVNNGTFDGFLFYPQSPNGYMGSYFSQISQMVDSLVKYCKVDIDRVIISGLSSGGQGTWDFLADYNKYFASAAPIAAAQTEDKPAMPKHVTIPIWVANGGTDRNPDPAAVIDVINEYKRLGGNIRQTYYPTLGHGVWNNFWAEADYFPFLNAAHKAIPNLVGDRSEFCPGEIFSVQLRLQAGFNAYEWEKDGVTITGANSNTLTVTTYGSFRGRYKRTATSSWSDWSPKPIVFKVKQATVTPPIQVQGLQSLVLPAPDGKTTTTLFVPNTYAQYEWRRVIDNVLVGTSNTLDAPSGQYKVKVTEQFGCSSEFSAPFTVVSANGTNVPEKTTNLTATTITNGSIQLDWSDNPNPLFDETGFEIYRALNPGGPFELVNISNANTLTYINQGLNPKTKYYYIVRAVNSNGAAPISDEVTATTFSDIIPPTVPNNVRISSTTRNSITLDWDPSTDDIGVYRYDIYVNGSKAYSTENINYTVFNLVPNQTYNLYVIARDVSGNNSPASLQVTGIARNSGLTYKYYEGNWSTLPNFSLLTPKTTGTSSIADISVKQRNDQFGFLWEGTINIPVAGTYTFETISDDGSKLYIGSYSHTATALVNNDGLHGSQARTGTVTLPAGPQQIAITFFESGGGEAMQVWWTNVAGGIARQQIPASAFVDVVIPSGIAPVPPSSLTAVREGYGKINLSWSDNSNNETSFEIARASLLAGPYLPIATVGANKTSYIDSIVSASTKYWYKLRAVNQNGESVFTNSYSASWGFNNGYLDESGFVRTLSGSSITFNATDKVEGTHSILLNGTSSYINMPFNTGNNFPSSGYTARTIGLWIKPVSAALSGANRIIFDFGGSDNGLALMMGNNLIQAGIASSNNRLTIATGNLTLDPNWVLNGWNHIAVVYSGSTLKLFVNGVEKAANNALSFSSILSSTNRSRIGLADGTNAFNITLNRYSGLIDAFNILEEALDVNGIQLLKNNSYSNATTDALPGVPLAPTNLIANATSSSVIVLNWNDNSNNETGYEIYRSVSNSSNFRLLQTLTSGSGAIVNFSDTGLYSNVNYYYKVRAIGVGGASIFTSESSAKTLNNDPVFAVVNNFTMRYSEQKTVSISVTDVDGDNLTFTPQNLPSFAQFNNTANGSGSLILNPEFANQGTFVFDFIANDVNGGTSSLSFTVVINDNYSPVINTVSEVSINEGSANSINLSANDQDGNVGLIWSSANLPSFASISGNDGNGVLELNPGYAHAGTYQLSIIVTDNSGGSDVKSLQVTVSNNDPKSSKVYLNISQTGLPQAATPWNNISGLNSQGFVDEAGNVTSLGLEFMNIPWNSYTDGAVTGNNSGVYPDYVIRDYFYFGVFGIANTVDFKLKNLSSQYKYNVTLFGSSRWSGASDNGTTVYTINGVSKSIYVQNNSQRTVTFSGLSADVSGNIVVNMSKGSNTPVGYLNSILVEQVFDDGTVPAKPDQLTAVNQSNGFVKLNWNDIAYNETNYEVYRSQSENGVYTFLSNVAANSSNFIDSTPISRTQYFYRIAAKNDYGSSEATISVGIFTTNKNPILPAINNVYLKATNSNSININASDDEGENLVVSVTGLPSFASFSATGNGTGIINVAPGAENIGLYKGVTVLVSDNYGGSVSRVFDITISDNNTRTVLLNFAKEGNAPAEKPWNNINSYPFANLALGNLKDESDVNTGYTVTLLDQWTQTWDGGMVTGNNSGIYPDAVLGGSIYEGTTNSKRVRISGLNSSRQYNIGIISSNNSGINATVYISSGSKSLTFDSRYNNTIMPQLNGLVPNGSGEIIVTFTKDAASPYMFLNGLVIQELDPVIAVVRPINLVAEAQSPDKIKLTWTERAINETGYEIWRASSSNGLYSLVATTSTDVASYTDGGLSHNIRYFYKVRAVNGGTSSDFSNSANTILSNNIVLLNLDLNNPAPAPWNSTSYSPIEGATFNNLKNTLGNNTGYEMVITDAFDGTFDLGETGGTYPDNVTKSSYWIEGGGETAGVKFRNLNQSKVYRIGIFASSTWEGDFTSIYTIGDRSIYYNCIKNKFKTVYFENVKANSNGELEIKIATKAGARWGFTGAFIIETLDDISGNVPSFTISNERNRGVIEVTEEAKTGNSSVSVVSGFKVFPNPFNQDLSVNLQTVRKGKLSIQLYDMTGRQVYKQDFGSMNEGFRTIRLDMSKVRNASPGIYILQVLFDGKIEKTVKLSKVR